MHLSDIIRLLESLKEFKENHQHSSLDLENILRVEDLVETAKSKKQIMGTPYASDRDVHTEHCCKNCGCKYADTKCSVITNKKNQSFSCLDGNCDEWF